jgi:Flp pilus assembly protein TadD
MPETSVPDRGLAALRRKDHRAAIADFRRHLAEHPEDATAWHNLGLALSRMEEWQPARDAYLAALKRAPSQAETHNALGLAFRHLGDAANAEKAYRNALRHDPRLAAAWNNLGQLHILGRDYARAMKALARALELDPDNPAIRGNVGLAHYQAGRPAAAAAAWEREFVLRQPELAWNQALAALGRRDWESGWRLYEARFFRAPRLAVGRHFTALPRWHGQPLPAGARLRVWGEQGAGDQIQFARFLPALRALGVPLTLACHYGLAPLFAASFGDVAVEPLKRGEQAGLPGELAVPLCDLPACLGLKASTDYYVPAPYLTPSRAARERWAARLPAAPGRPARVGLVWAGAGTHVADALRSLPFEAIARLVAAHPEIEFHSLQVGPHADDLVGSGLPLRDWSALLRDYDDTAALIERLDRVLSVDTSVAHLAGALGRPAEVLLKFEPEWRWSRVAGGDPAATFWYPSLHLLRQPAPGDWAPPLAAADAALAALRPGPDPAGPRGAPALPAAVAAFLARPFAVAQLEALLAAASAARQASALRHGRVAAADPACAALLIRRMAGAGQQREARPMLAAYLRQRPDDFDLTLDGGRPGAPGARCAGRAGGGKVGAGATAPGGKGAPATGQRPARGQAPARGARRAGRGGAPRSGNARPAQQPRRGAEGTRRPAGLHRAISRRAGRGTGFPFGTGQPRQRVARQRRVRRVGGLFPDPAGAPSGQPGVLVRPGQHPEGGRAASPPPSPPIARAWRSSRTTATSRSTCR